MALVKPVYFNSAEAINQEMNPLVDTAAFAQITLNGVSGVGLNANGQSITGLPTPVNPSDASTKSYVDTLVQGLDPKQSVAACATQNITLSGTQTVDGVALSVGQRVLVTGQTNAVQNGIWLVQSGNWMRPVDFNTGSAADAAFTFVEGGTVNADNGFVCASISGSAVIDTNNLAFTQFSGAGEITAGSGIAKSGNTLAVSLASPSGLQFTSNKLDTYLNPSGALAKDTNGLRLSIVNSGTSSATLGSTVNGLAVLGVPSLYTINGTPVSANVTAATTSQLVAGSTTQADSLHTHLSVLGANAVIGYHTCSSSLAAGDPVAWSTTNNQLVRGDATIVGSSRIIGVAAAAGASGTTVAIVKRGIATGVFTNGTAGSPVFLNSGGGLTLTAPSGQSLTLVRVGHMVNATDAEINPYFLGLRSA